ncbi:50S ribosomal protein L9 [Candidatus Kaiserbacteria bacterium]|nr:50S ribosomal protein L9 [Candidatus Kaiserbacteria bacterium]
MKVILLRDVKKIGHAHEVIEAKDGYALNYLIPQKFAISATPTALKEAELRRRQAAAHKEIDAKLVAERIAALAEARVVLKVKANEQGHLYDGVGEREIADAANLPAEAIKLEKPFKELGTFKIPVALGGVFGEFLLAIEAE